MKKVTIFYADDDEDDLMFFEEAVSTIRESNSSDTIDLILLKNGENLIHYIENKKQEASIVFLDLNMPLKSGFELLEEIRSRPDINKIPVIMYSTSTNDTNISKSQKLGANYYAVKPNSFKDLVKIISNAVQYNWENHSTDTKNFIFNRIAI